jgi:hypothetical protein
MNVAKENTFRALKDERLIVDSFLCRIGWHRWTTWSNPYIPKGGQVNLQDSHCAVCNKMRVRKLRDDQGHIV